MGLIRKLMLEARNRLEGREEKDEAIYERFFTELSDEVKTVFIYAGFGSEVSTTKIRETLLSRGITVCCPKVVDKDIYFFPIGKISDLEPGYFNIPEPVIGEDGRDIQEVIAEKAMEPSDTPDCLMVIPGSVFDEHGGRYGYGAGMYDRYLISHPCRKLALAYEIQVRPKPLSLKPTDVRVDALLTEERFLEFGKA